MVETNFYSYEFVKSSMPEELLNFQKAVDRYYEGPAIYAVQDGHIVGSLHYHKQYLFDTDCIDVRDMRTRYEDNMLYLRLIEKLHAIEQDKDIHLNKWILINGALLTDKWIQNNRVIFEE